MDKRVKKAMEPYWTENFGNPNALYKEGLIARSAVETARKDIAKIIGARAKEIIFTNGGTESDNLAIFGVVHAMTGGVRKLTSLRTDEEGNPTEAKFPNSSLGSVSRPHIITTKF